MRAKAKGRRAMLVLCGLALALASPAAPAQASRALLTEKLLLTIPSPPLGIPPTPPPEGEIEGACGLATSAATLYVSDYYHHVVDVFSIGGDYSSQIVEPPVGICGLAAGPGGTLYGNEWHRGVLRLTPTVQSVDTNESTGVAVDGAGNVYVDDRTYVAKYEAPLDPGDEPVAKIGIGGSLGDAYGVAVFGGKVYVPDAADDVIEVYEPATEPLAPVATIDGSATPKGAFVSLVDAAVAVDPTNGHLLVADNTQPGFVHPKAALYEFSGEGAFLGKLVGSPVVGEPTGLAVASDGTLFVTDGNDEEANVYKYSAYGGGGSEVAGPGPGSEAARAEAVESSPAPGSAIAGASGTPRPAHPLRGNSQLVQKGPIRVAVSGSLAPTRLPRHGTAPITVTVGGRISSTDPQTPPQLRKVSFAFSRAGHLDTDGLPVCRLTDIDPSSTSQALEACRPSLVGEGRFAANVRLPEQSPFPSAGKVVAFNGKLKGKPVIFAHIYGTRPVPTSVVLPLEIHQSGGTFGTHLDASLVDLTGDWGYVKEISLRLGRKFSAHGERRSFLAAGCPAPKGFPGALFPLARTSFSFVGGKTLSATLTRSCTVR